MKPAKTSFWSAPLERTKREEFRTYHELALSRALKSARQRRRIETGGMRRVLGDGSSERPYIIVEMRRYREVRLEIQRRLLAQARQMNLALPIEALLRQLEPRLEAQTYVQLAAEAAQEAQGRMPLAALGRALTEVERRQFAASLAISPAGSAPAGTSAHLALNQVLGHIEQRQTHNPARYQTIWAQTVGSEAAQQSQLERIDPATGIAWFRCLNSVLSSDLQRRPGLAAKLARALGLPVRQLRAKF